MAEDPELTTYKNTRLNALAVAAFIVVILCAVVAVFVSNINEYAKGIITFLLGRFSGYVDNVYSFEFGTTRGSKAKDDVITNLASASPTAPSNVTANATASPTVKSTAPQGDKA